MSDLMDLGRRAVDLVPVERWPAGAMFRCSHGENWIISSNTDDGCYVLSQHGDEYPYPGVSVIPLVLEATALLDEPATLGCLLALVREAWGPAARVTLHHDGGVRVSTDRAEHICGGLVAALEAAPVAAGGEE